MVQRKAPSNLGSQTETRNAHLKQQRSFSPNRGRHHQQDTRSKAGGADNKKQRMKMLRSLEEALVHENLQLDKPPSMKRLCKPPNYMKPTRSSDAKKEQAKVRKPSSPSPAKVLVRKCSFKLVRMPSMKSVSRATCSSIQKDSKFAEALDLNPGGTEANGTSVIKVCPYNYCSLNGDRHAALPPLKSFLSARRQSLKNQKNMKIKKAMDDGTKNMDTEQREIEEVVDDFFVEMYVREQEDDKIENPQVANSLPVIEDDGDGREAVDRNSEVSVEELDVLINVVEYVECDRHVEEVEGEPEDCASWILPRKESSGLAEDEPNLSEYGTTHTEVEEETGQYPDIIIECSEYVDDWLRLIVEIKAKVPHEVKEDVSRSFNFALGAVANNDNDEERQVRSVPWCSTEEETSDTLGVLFQNQLTEQLESPEDENDELVIDESSSSIENVSESVEDNIENGSQDQKEYIEEKESRNGEVFSNVEGFSEADDTIIDGDFVKEGLYRVCVDDFSREVQNKIFEIHNNKDDEASNEEVSKENELVQINTDGSTDEDEICIADSILFSEGNSVNNRETAKTNRSLNQSSNNPRVSITITRKKRTEELEAIQRFNPRPPNFLPLETDPETEKVDLRHQEMDERKNAEEWMLDYAVQQVVTKLSPGMKRKVELLVEAFETIMPLTL